MLKDKTLCQFLNIEVEVDKPFIITHNGNGVYYEHSDGRWYKCEYDSEGREIYHENSNGHWWKNKYDSNDKQTYYEDSDGDWWRCKYDSQGNQTYYEDSDGDWLKKVHDTNGKMIYREDSNGYIYDKRPKEISMDDIAKKFGIPVEQLKIKKD